MLDRENPDCKHCPIAVRLYQGIADVIRLVDYLGNTAAYYEYDPYGNPTHASGSHATINPLRYRGYYYDTETGMYYLQNRYYDPEIGRFINADNVDLLGANNDFASLNLFAYCGNNPVARADNSGYLWNAVIGAAAGAVVGIFSATLMDTDITAGIVSGALSGAVSGVAIDLAITSSCAGLIACAGVAFTSAAGSAVSSYVNQQMNGVPFAEADPGTIIIDAIWGAVGGALSFGTADVGGKMCKTLAENLALKGKDFWNQVGSDFATSLITTAGTWLNGTKMNLLSEA